MDGPATLKARRGSMSQQALATALGVSIAAVGQWERGIYTPRRDTAQRIDDYLEADGAILAAFGYFTQQPSADDRLAALQEQVERMAAEIRDLQRDVGLLGGATVRASRRAKPAEPRSPGGAQ